MHGALMRIDRLCALEEALAGYDDRNPPVGAVIVKDATIVVTGRHRHHRTQGPTTHPELVEPAQRYQSERDEPATLAGPATLAP